MNERTFEQIREDARCRVESRRGNMTLYLTRHNDNMWDVRNSSGAALTSCRQFDTPQDALDWVGNYISSFPNVQVEVKDDSTK